MFQTDQLYWTAACLQKKLSEFLDSHVKGYIKDSNSNDFINKTKNLKDISQEALLVTADVVGLYPSIPLEDGLRALKEALDK